MAGDKLGWDGGQRLQIASYTMCNLEKRKGKDGCEVLQQDGWGKGILGQWGTYLVRSTS